MEEILSHNLKEIASRYAVNNFVENGMTVGLGSGSTAAYAVEALAERISSEGLGIAKMIATSAETSRLAFFHGMTAARELNAITGWLDVTIDGADEVDPDMNVIKGGGGALVRERLVALRTKREVIVVDESKLSSSLGERHAVPIMIVPAAWETTAERVADVCGATPKLRLTPVGDPFVSDDGLYCLDVETGPIGDVAKLEQRIKLITGVVDSGLFVGIAHTIVVAKSDGKVDVYDRSE
jgi:ribose 5-phosphate isomerase A